MHMLPLEPSSLLLARLESGELSKTASGCLFSSP